MTRSIFTPFLLRQAAILALALTPVVSRADIITPFAPPATGSGVAVPPGGTDPNWQVVALPTSYSGSATPYQAYVFSGTGSGALPALWLGGSANDGAEGARWIGVRDVPGALFPPTGTANPGSDYNMIYAYAFTQGSAGTIDFDFWAAVDNQVQFFLNGTVLADALTPSISGGTPIGSPTSGLGKLRNFSASGVSVVSGTNYLYAVVTDKWDPITGGWGATGLIVAPVPEPSTMILTAVGIAAVGVARLRRRSKARS